MGYVTIKPDPDQDLYVIFSSGSDLPVCWGPAEQMLKWAIKDEYSNQHNRYGIFGDKYYEKIDLADKFGTSSRGFTDRWTDENPGMMWMNEGIMPFSNIPKALEFMEKGKKADSKKVLALLDPFERE